MPFTAWNSFLDAATYDSTVFWLAHVHPAWMLAAIALAALALRAGLRLRAARRGAGMSAGAARAALRARHILLGKIAVLAIGLGFGGGLVSVVWLRGWQVFGSAHGLVACAALVLFVSTAVLGRRLERGLQSGADRRARRRHAALGLLALLAAAAAFGTGFVLLP